MNAKTIPLSILSTIFSLKSFIPALKIWLFIIPLFILDAQEPAMVKLNLIYDNTYQSFQTSEYSFTCQPYGVVTLDQLLNSEKSNKECKKRLKKFYTKHPDLKNIAYKYLYEDSFYHLRYKENSCIVYAKGMMSYSEILLKEGLAIVKRGFKDEEFRSYFLKAQESAKIRKKGIYSDTQLHQCLELLR